MKEVFDFFNQVKNIEYGWHDKEGNIHKTLKEHKEKFILQDNDTIIRDNHAVCLEMCELQRDFFNKHDIENKTIIACLNTEKNIVCHTFSVFFMNDKCFWFEASWKNKKGIHEFNTLEDVLEYYRDNFIDFTKVEYNRDEMYFVEYDGIKPGMNTEDYMMQCQKGKFLK